ncbi:MAG TPA: hypothetical protein VF516_34235 [Kofleriaceae bacterium]
MCMAGNMKDWNKDFYGGNPFFETPFDGPCPKYCKKGDRPPKSDYGDVQLPANTMYPTCKPV